MDEPPQGASVQRSVPEEVLAHGPHADVGFTVDELGRGAPPGTFVDFAPLHLLTTAALAATNGAAPERYRPNVLVRTPDGAPGFVENGWVEGEPAIGPELRPHVVTATPRCAVPTLAHGPGCRVRRRRCARPRGATGWSRRRACPRCPASVCTPGC
ncbi:hypothetical protein [Kitasatospora sp. NPDC001527]|uniref:hypothetical protein n=1 Tax=Kitasatospora sp. NPDC001527 TaxID=3154519 RepID=UPI0033192F8A